ncbi:Spy/CpxP family protein refolding chaperone [uncultured Neptuniibacter sp.]|uniref:Spy/CpxP family protein refolding chaperone n=1 Tax=uncultured Neptuniibacter sp. TaxID=502143 RepID=UPI002638CC7E|nr:Spy/CpxP family protein refolding chaperone [uncultured Neptuniibacter sp.]
MRIKVIAGITATLIALSGIGVTAAYAKGGHNHMERKLEYLTEALDLTPAQEKQLRENIGSKADTMKTHHQSRKEIRTQLMQLDPAAENYQTQLDSLILKAQEQTKTMITAKAAQQEALYEVLTPKQEKQYVELKSKIQERMSKRFGEGSEHHGFGGKKCH